MRLPVGDRANAKAIWISSNFSENWEWLASVRQVSGPTKDAQSLPTHQSH